MQSVSSKSFAPSGGIPTVEVWEVWEGEGDDRGAETESGGEGWVKAPGKTVEEAPSPLGVAETVGASGIGGVRPSTGGLGAAVEAPAGVVASASTAGKSRTGLSCAKTGCFRTIV